MFQDQITLKKRHESFVKDVSENEIVYALRNNQGFATSSSNEIEDEEGNPVEIICFWSNITLAKSCIKDEWNDYKVEEISLSEFLENWCVGMANDEIILGTNFDQNLFGYEIEPLDVILEIINELDIKNKQIDLLKFDGIKDLKAQVKKLV